MKPSGNKTGKAVLAGVLAVCLSLSAFSGLSLPKAKAATKRTAISQSLLLSSGRINPADWITEGDASKFEITNNGKVFEFAKDAAIGYRIMAFDPIAAGKGFSMYFDVVKTDPAATKINISGMTEGVNEGAKSNVFVSALGIDPGAGTDWAAEGYDKTFYTPDGTGTVGADVANLKLEAGYRYVFTMRPSEGTEGRADLLLGRAKTSELGEGEVQEQALFKKLLHVDNSKAHYAMLYAPTSGGALVIDNFLVKDEDGAVKCDLDFSDSSKIGTNPAAPIAGGIWNNENGGEIKSDTYLTLNSPATSDRLVTLLAAKKDVNSPDALSVSASVRLDSAAGKAGMIFGMADERTAIGAEGTVFLYFEQGEGTTKVNVMNGGTAASAQDLGVDLTQDFEKLDIRIKTDGTLTVSVGGAVKATYPGCGYEGYIALATDGTEGAKLSFLPELQIDNFEYVTGDGENLENNFDSGWINPNNYINDTHPAVSLGANAKGIEIKDGVLRFNGTSDGTYFAFKQTYADFVLQFDWINDPWESRPTDEEGKVLFKEKPAEGRGAELYSPLCIGFGLSSPTPSVVVENYLVRLFDGLNLIQFMEKGVGQNVTMGKSFSTPEDCADIKEGMIDFYENTVNIKIVVRNNEAEIWGAVKTAENQTPEHKKLATFPIENYKGYVTFASGEAGYWGIDNLRLTNIDGWTDEQLAAYDNYKTIEREDKPEPVQLEKPVLTLSGKTVTWNEVAHALGYEVYVNGEKQGDAISVCTWTYEGTAEGTYSVTVKALGDGDLYLASEQSDAVSVVVSSGSGEGTTPEPKPEKKGCGCGENSAAAAIPAGAALLAALAFVIRKK